MIEGSVPRLVLAIVAATTAACAASFLVTLAFFVLTFQGEAQWFTSVPMGLAAAYFTLFICPPLFVVVGLPLYWFSLRRGWVSARTYVAAGALVSVIAVAVFRLVLPPLPGHLETALLLVGGPLSTLAFWATARPDLSH
jgi:hypothetical protein